MFAVRASVAGGADGEKRISSISLPNVDTQFVLFAEKTILCYILQFLVVCSKIIINR